MAQPTIYDLLTGQQLSELTVTNLNKASEVTYIDRDTVDFWVGPVTLAAILKASRTYGGGLPIPESSGIETMAIDDGASATLKPPAPGIYEVVSVMATTAVSIGVTDGSAISYTTALSGAGSWEPTHTFYLTDTLYLIVANNSGGASNVTVAYHTVGL